MKNFKEFLNEVESVNHLAKSVTRSVRPKTANAKQIGFLHFAHGVDYDVIQADSHDLAYFGKGVVRLKGRTTGRETAAYIDWKKGTVRFYSGNPNDDLDFEKPAKFKAASLYESLEDLELLENAALDLNEGLVKGRVYKLPSNDMRLMYTGRVKGEANVFTVVDASGKPRMVSGKPFYQEYKKDLVAKLVLAESEDLNEAAKGTREKVIAVLVKRGFNEKDAEKMTDKHLEDAMKIRPGATPGKLAEIVSTL
ncbi:hypothetical protein JC221_139 [Yersinia phage JC221]|nr:hypothetical protein JC221_139 [Yersinia phage JC221]